jgi:hypothetical protein
MTTQTALDVLLTYAEWRRHRGCLPWDLCVVEALDVAIAVLKKDVDIRNAIACIDSVNDLKKAAAALGKKGGLKRGPTKARTVEQARKAGLASAAARKTRQ